MNMREFNTLQDSQMKFTPSELYYKADNDPTIALNGKARFHQRDHAGKSTGDV